MNHSLNQLIDVSQAFKVDLHFIFDLHLISFDYHINSIQFHQDLFNADNTFFLLPFELNGEALIFAQAVRNQEVSALDGKLEDISIKGREVVVPPCAAEVYHFGWFHF